MAEIAAEEKAKIEIKVAETDAEREAIYRFRYRVYVEEMGKELKSYADHGGKRLKDKLDDSARLWYAESNGRIMGTLRGNINAACHMDDELRDHYQLQKFIDGWGAERMSFTSRLMIDQKDRRTMALPLLLNEAFAYALENGVYFDFCNCTPALVELYEHLGYRRYGTNFVDAEVGYRVPLVMMPPEAGHMQKVRSPFWRMLRKQKDLWRDDLIPLFTQTFPLAPTVQEWSMEEDDFWSFLTGKYQLSSASAVPLLEGLTESECGEVMRGTVLRCNAGDPVIRAGDVGSEMYVILSGAVEVATAGGERLAVFGPGQIIGEIAGLLKIKRTADVNAIEPAEILVLNQDRLTRLKKTVPNVAATILHNLASILAQRLVASTKKLSTQHHQRDDVQIDPEASNFGEE